MSPDAPFKTRLTRKIMASLEANDYSIQFHDRCIESWEDPEIASREFRFV